MQLDSHTRLQQLQEQLLALKAAHPGMKLTRTARAPTAPFPIRLVAALPAPDDSRFDVSSLTLTISLASSILQLPRPAQDAVTVTVASSELPRALRRHIAQALKQAWGDAVAAAAAAGPGASFGLRELLQYAASHHDRLIGSMQQFLEPYQAADASGATLRRYAIVIPDNDDVDDDRGENCGAQAAGCSSAGSGGGGSGGGGGGLHAAEVAPPDCSAVSAVPAPVAVAEAVAEEAAPAAVAEAAVAESAEAAGAKGGLSTHAAPFQPAAAVAGYSSSIQAACTLAGHSSSSSSSRPPGAAFAAAAGAVSDAGAACCQEPTAGSTRAAAAAGVRGRGRGRGRTTLPGRAIVRPGQQQQQQLPASVVALQDLTAVQRRYGRSFRLGHNEPQQQQHHQKQQGQQQQQHQKQQGQQQEQGQQQQQGQQEQQAAPQPDQLPQSFSLMLRPTDPQWGAARGSLHVTGRIDPSLYPAEGCLSLSIQPSRGVSAAESWVLQSGLDAERQRWQQPQQQQACLSGGRRQLLEILKVLENNAGAMLEQAHQAQLQLLGEVGWVPEQQQQQRQRQQQWRPRQQQQQPRQQQLPRQLPALPAAGAGVRIVRAAGSHMPQPQANLPAADAAAAPSGQEHGQQQDWQQEVVLRRLHSGSSGSSVEERYVPVGRGKTPRRSAAAAAAAASDGVMTVARQTCSDGDARSCSSSSSSRSSSTAGGGGNSSDGHDDDRGLASEVQLFGGGGGEPGGDGIGGFALAAESLSLDNVGVLELLQAALQLVCGRCNARLAVSLTLEGGWLSGPPQQAAGSGNTAAAAAAADSAAGSAGPDSSGLAAARAPAAAGQQQQQCPGQRAAPFSWSGSCSACGWPLLALLRPKFAHDSSNILGSVKVVGCRPLDLLPSVFGATCSECDAVVALRGLQVGAPFSRHCSHCHRQLAVSIPAVSFVPRGPPGDGSSRRAAAGGAQRQRKPGAGGSRAGVLVEGTPLPHQGACKHYRHSYRWLRFPCCGARFPCDLCHEEATADGHDAAWASRMVCGFCSREQPLAPACSHCGKKLAGSASQPTGRSTRFWEGGRGCRDVRALDRRDVHKHRGRAKTQSAKASRVGPKPWSGRGGGSGAAAAGAARGSRSD